MLGHVNKQIFKVELKSGKNHLSDQEIIKDFKISDDVAQYEAQLANSPNIDQEDISDIEVSEEKLTVLIVEDHKVLRSFMKNLLNLVPRRGLEPPHLAVLTSKASVSTISPPGQKLFTYRVYFLQHSLQSKHRICFHTILSFACVVKR